MDRFKLGSKVMIIDWLRFKLPDNFSGTLSNALRLLATHMEAPTDKVEPTDSQPNPNTMQGFADAVADGCLVTGAAQIACLDEKEGQRYWRQLPMGNVYKKE